MSKKFFFAKFLGLLIVVHLYWDFFPLLSPLWALGLVRAGQGKAGQGRAGHGTAEQGVDPLSDLVVEHCSARHGCS